MPYAVVQDVPASWEHYAPLAETIADPVPEGLIFHLAGPTDEGFRTIEVWESQEAWERFRELAGQRELSPEPSWAPPVLRELRALNAVGAVLASSPKTTTGGE